MRHSTRCLTASKPITPRSSAALTPASTSSGRNTSSKRRTWTNSRLPGLPMRADLTLQQRQVVQWVEDEVLALVGPGMTGDLLGAAASDATLIARHSGPQTVP